MRAIVQFLCPLAFLALFAPGCGQSSAEPKGTPTPAMPPVPRPRAVVRAFSTAAPETIHLSPSLASEQEHAQPTIDYATFEVARDSIGAIVRRAVNSANPAIRMSGGPVRFTYWYVADSADGWAFRIAVADTSECPNEPVGSALQAAGWAPNYTYSADGPDGSVMGFVTKRFLCVVEGHWEGGDGSDSTYVPPPGCEATVTCVPWRGDDVPK